jgi:hypothetical protein
MTESGIFSYKLTGQPVLFLSCYQRSILYFRKDYRDLAALHALTVHV